MKSQQSNSDFLRLIKGSKFKMQDRLFLVVNVDRSPKDHKPVNYLISEIVGGKPEDYIIREASVIEALIASGKIQII